MHTQYMEGKKNAFNFTIKILDGLPLPEKKGGVAKYFDSKENGLALYVRNSGARSFYFDRKLGTKWNIKLGELSDLLPDDARRLVRKIAAEIEAGTYVSPTGQRAKAVEERKRGRTEKATAGEIRKPAPANYSSLTLREVVADMLTTKRYSEKTLETYDRCLRIYLADITDAALLSVTRRKVQEVINAERKRAPSGKYPKGGSEATAAQAQRLLSSAWNYAAASFRNPDESLIFGENPTKVLAETGTAPEVDTRDTAIMPEDLGAWWDAVENYYPHNPRWRDSRHVMVPLAKCLLLTGWRFEQLAALQWDRVDLERGVFNVRKGDSKNGLAATMPMCDTVRELLRGLRQRYPDGLRVFPSPLTTCGYVQDLDPLFAVASEAIGYRITAHDLRRTFISYGEACGYNDITLKRLSGHKVSGKQNVTAGYMRSFPFAMRNVANGVERLIMRIINEGIDAVTKDWA